MTLQDNRKRSMMQRLKMMQDLEKLRTNQKKTSAMDTAKSGIKLANNMNKLSDGKLYGGIQNKFNSFTGNTPSSVGTLGEQGSSIANATSNVAPSASALTNGASIGGDALGNISSASNLGNTGSLIGNAAAAETGANLAQGASTGASALSSGTTAATGAAGSAASGLGSAMPAIGGVMNGAQAAKDFANKDYVGGALNGIAAGASFVPGVGTVVAMGTKGLDMINKALRSAKDKANAKAMNAANKEIEAAKQEQAENKNMFSQGANENLQQLAQETQTQPTGTYIPEVPQAYEQPELPQEEQLPQEPVQETTQADNSGIISSIMNRFRGTPTGGAAGMTAPSIAEDGTENGTISTDANGVTSTQTKQGLWDRFRENLGSLGDIKTGYEDNVTNDFSHGDLARKYGLNSAQAQAEGTPTPDYAGLETAMKEGGYTPEQIAAAKQGLNGGGEQGKGIAELVDKYHINKPTTEADIANARAGKFNTEAIQGGVTATPEDHKKTILERLGEGIGTAQRIASNPMTQGLISLALNRRDGENWVDSATNAMNWASKKAESDRYQKMLDPNSRPSLTANYSADDYKTQMAQRNNERDYARSVVVGDREFTFKTEKDKRDFEWNKEKFGLEYALEKAKTNASIAHMANSDALGWGKLNQDQKQWEWERSPEGIKYMKEKAEAWRGGQGNGFDLVPATTDATLPAVNPATQQYYSKSEQDAALAELKRRGLLQ